MRDIEELLFERGVVVSYETIRRWCDKFGASFAHRAKAASRKPQAASQARPGIWTKCSWRCTVSPIYWGALSISVGPPDKPRARA
jgi:hypothetical protein